MSTIPSRTSQKFITQTIAAQFPQVATPFQTQLHFQNLFLSCPLVSFAFTFRDWNRQSYLYLERYELQDIEMTTLKQLSPKKLRHPGCIPESIPAAEDYKNGETAGCSPGEASV
jgi:hypothetical protein